MKNDSKIVELLAESLKKQDQMIERQDRQEELLSKHQELLSNQQELLNVLVQGQAQLLLTTKDLVENQKETNKRLISIEEKLTEISDLRRRIEEIEKYIGMK